MNFSGEDRKDVFFFFEHILKSYKQPVHCENLRGHVSQAPLNIRKYVLHKCRGDNFIEYFKRRKNYFYVENDKISLKDEFGDGQLENFHTNKGKKKNSKGKFVRRSTTYSHSSYASALKGGDSNGNAEKENESIAITYFRNRLVRKKTERLWAIEFIDLPKKVKRHLQIYYKSNVKNFLCNFPEKFMIDSDNETVSLVYVCESVIDVSNPSTINQASSTNSNQDIDNVTVNSDFKKMSDYLECIKFFIVVLKKLDQPFPIEKLGGYFSQASKEIKDYVKMNYRSFKFFFDDIPLIFLKNASEEVSLSREYRKLIKAAENLIKKSKDGLTLKSEVPLKSHIDLIFHPKISSQQPLSCFEETYSNNKIMPFECMKNTTEDSLEKNLKLDIIEVHSDIHFESTEDYFDNYLMRTNYRGSSNSVSSRSTRSTSVGDSSVEDYSVTKKIEFESQQIQVFSDKEISDNIFLRYILTVELFCLEFMESELNYIQVNENKAVEYFMEILDTSPTKVWKLSSLQGSIGNNREIAQFMNKLYKGEKFVSFFQSHPQFEIDPPFIKLALADKSNCSEDIVKEEKETRCLKDLYELNNFRILLRETYVYLHEVCQFCEDKSIKVERLSGILARFPNSLNMIKSLKGQSLLEKIKYFLRETMIFKFPEKENIFFPYNYLNKTCHILFVWFEKMNCCDPSVQFVNFSNFWKNTAYSTSDNRKNNNGYVDLEVYCQNIVNIVEDEIKSRSEMNYYELSKIIPEYALSVMTIDNYYSKFMISTLLKNGRFRMENGKISLQTVAENYNSNNEDNGKIETVSAVQNNLSEESSNKIFSQQNICDNNITESVSSLSIGSKGKSNYSKESKTELEHGSNQHSEIFQVKDHCEKKETYSPSEESKSNQNFKDDKMTDNPSFIFENKNEHLNSINDHFISKISKKSILQDESRKDITVCTKRPLLCSTKDNSCSETPLTHAESFNSTIEFSKLSKSMSDSKALNSVKECESIENVCNCEDKINSEIVSPLNNSYVLKELNIPSPFQSPEFEDYPKENQAFLSMYGSSNTLELGNDQMQLSFNEFNLQTDNVVSLNKRCDISIQPELESLEKSSLPEQIIHQIVSNENILESNIEVSKVEQNVFSKCKDKESDKLEIDLDIKQNSNDHLKSETTQGRLLNDLELTNGKKYDSSVKPELKSLEKDSFAEQGAICEVSNKNVVESSVKSLKVEQNIGFNCKDNESTKFEIDLNIEQNTNDHLIAKTETTQRQISNNLKLTNQGTCNNSIKRELESLEKGYSTGQNDIHEVSNKNIVESTIQTSKEKQNIVFKWNDDKSSKFEIDLDTKQNSSDLLESKTKMTTGRIEDSLELTIEDKHSTIEKRNCYKSEQMEEKSFHNDVLHVSNFNKTDSKINSAIIKDFKKAKEPTEFPDAINKNVSAKQSFIPAPEELFDTSLLKQHLNSEEGSDRKPHVTNEMYLEYSSVSPTPSLVQLKDTNISKSIYNHLSSKCPMQSFPAKVVLLTNNSCIALANIKEHKQIIYFFRYVFVCEHQDDCLHCFSVLQIGDGVSCFVPLTEVSQKIWVAIMVTKDNSDNLNELGIHGKLKENTQTDDEGSAKTSHFSAYIKHSVDQFGYQADITKCDNYCQTTTNNDLYKELSTQTRLVLVKHVSVQTERLNMAYQDQVGFKHSEMPLHRKCSRPQIYFNDDSEKTELIENTTSQSKWHEVKSILTKNVGCQTLSTGIVFMSTFHPI